MWSLPFSVFLLKKSAVYC